MATPARDRYWAIFEQLRSELGYADYLGALERYRLEDLHDPRVLQMSNWLVDYPFADRLYPGALDVGAARRAMGPARGAFRWRRGLPAAQGRAVGRLEAFDDDILIYVHKEQELDDVERLYPAKHYALIDDKLRILAAVKKIWGDRVTTVFPRQGHYANDLKTLAAYPPADVRWIGSAICLRSTAPRSRQTDLEGVQR